MCGIVGFASPRPIADDSTLAKGIACLSHRGPDDGGEWWSADRRVGLAHRRLAIIDLTPAGHQPMLDVESGTVIVFNGEIYNYRDLRRVLAAKGHRFRGASDTEVILMAYREWGTGCLQHLNGMFAFALFDGTRQRMFMARDRAGEKPLYYRLDTAGLRFASELKALMVAPDFPRVIDREALDCYLAMGYVPGDRSILRGVNKLPPAHALSFDIETGTSDVWRYWALPALTIDPGGARDEGELLDELDKLLEDAVARQLVADVPVGVLLSGGVDSSLITAMAVRAATSVKTFTVRFPGFGEYDETDHARLVARHFRTEHVELQAEQTSVDLLPVLAQQFDEPMVDSSMIPTFLVSRLIRQHCTVALGGDGGDELFGGYGHYRRMLWLQRKAALVPLSVRRVLARAGSAALPIGAKGRNWLQALGTDFAQDVPPIQNLFDAATRVRLMAAHDWIPAADAVLAGRLPRGGDLLQRATRLDFENYMAEDILVKVDRASMLSSLEVRAPFLDVRIIEFAFARVPSSQKATPAGLKVLLKKLCGRVLPPEFDRQRKQGFSIPLDHWLAAGPWADFFRQVLLDGSDNTFDKRIVRSLLAGQTKGRRNGERLFALTMFELWRREYGVSL